MYLYDEAITNAFKEWTGDNKIIIQPPETAFLRRVDVNSDLITLPLISIQRLSMRILNTSKQPLSFEGATIGKGKSVDMVAKLRAVPLQLHYQVDVYTTTLRENDMRIRELVFKIINVPKLQIEIPYNGCNMPHQFNMRLGPDITDNSDITAHIETGQIFRQTLEMWVDDAYLFSYGNKEIATLREVSIKRVSTQGEFVELE